MLGKGSGRMQESKWRFVETIILFAVLLWTLAGCGMLKGAGTPEKIERTGFAMDTVNTLTAYGSHGKKAVEQSFMRINEIDQRMNALHTDSDIYKVNTKPGQDVIVHEDTFFVVEKGLYYSYLSHEVFDIAILPLVKLWNINDERARTQHVIPTSDQIKGVMDKIDSHLVAINKSNQTIQLKRQGMGLDLGAIAKGYAADEVARIFKENGITSGMINLGGNVLAIGNKPDGGLWRVAIKDPRGEIDSNSYYAILQIANKAVVTSGDYERFYIQNGIRYHHILDASTGAPSRSGLISATIITDQSIDADALSTTVFILGVQKGLDYLKQFPGVDALFVTEDKKVYATFGIRKILEITNKEYKLQP